MQIAIGVPARQTSQLAEVALNITGILNLIMHVFLRSNADRSAIRAVEAPWSGNRSIRLFGPSDLNIRDHISYPVLCAHPEHDFGRDMEKDHAPTPAISRTPSEADSIEKYLGQLDSKSSTRSQFSSPAIKESHKRSSTPARPSYSIFPHRDSFGLRNSDSTTSVPSVQKIGDLPLPPAPLFTQGHSRAVSAQSTGSATVQIGLRLSYMGHALDPIEQSPPSNLQPDFRTIAPVSPLSTSVPLPVAQRPSLGQVSLPSKVFIAPQQIYLPPQKMMKPRQIDIPPALKRSDITILPVQLDEPQISSVPAPVNDTNVSLPTKSPRTPASKVVPEWRPPVWKPKTPTATTSSASGATYPLSAHQTLFNPQSSASS